MENLTQLGKIQQNIQQKKENILKGFQGDLEKGGFPNGTIRTYKNGEKWKKTGDKWVKLTKEGQHYTSIEADGKKFNFHPDQIKRMIEMPALDFLSPNKIGRGIPAGSTIDLGNNINVTRYTKNKFKVFNIYNKGNKVTFTLDVDKLSKQTTQKESPKILTSKEKYIEKYKNQKVDLNAENMCKFNEFSKTGEQFTKKEIQSKNLSAVVMNWFNEFTKDEQFTKKELLKQDPDEWEMGWFNKYTKEEEKFTLEEIQNRRNKTKGNRKKGKKDIKINYNDCRFRINSPEESKKVQEKLFEAGHEWVHSGKNVSHVDSPFLYITEGHITYGDSSDYFYNHSNQEIDLEDLM